MVRTIVGGSPVAAVRRIVLYLILGVVTGLAPMPWAAVGLVALLLLAVSDRYV